MKFAILLTQRMSGRHTADNLTATLIDVVETWGLTGKVSACVHDKACNIAAANFHEQMKTSLFCAYTATGGKLKA